VIFLVFVDDTMFFDHTIIIEQVIRQSSINLNWRSYNVCDFSRCSWYSTSRRWACITHSEKNCI